MLRNIYILTRRVGNYIKAGMFLIFPAKNIWKWMMQGVGLIFIVIAGYFLLQNIQKISKPLLSLAYYQKPIAAQPTHAKHIGLIDITGPIIDLQGSALGTQARNIMISIARALDHPNSTGIILRINSSGSPLVAAGQIYEFIRAEKQRHPNKSIIAVCTTICTRASYYVASACDAIFAAESSMIGGIGLHYEQIGYVDSLKKLGIERRLMAAGKNKAALDQYSPMTNEARQMMQGLLNDWHNQLIEGIKANRGDRLKDLDKNADILFSGRIWFGKEALNLGLLDGLGNIYSVSQEVLKQTKLVDYSIRPNIMQSILGV